MNASKPALLASLVFLSTVVSVSADEPQRPITIGVALPLTGEDGTWGEHVRQGLELGRADAKHHLTFDYQDEGNCLAQQSVNAVNKFLSLGSGKILFMGCLAGTKAAA